MRPVRTAKTTTVFTSNAAGVGELFSYHEDGANWSVWTLTDEERRFIADGGNIRLGVLALSMPPVVLEVTGEQAVPE